ncbi:hypothetical protein AB4Z32_27770, partial [Massilia sp. 2TAF26]
MSKLALLREQRDVLAKQIHELNAKTPSDKRMSSEDAEKIDKILDEVAKVDAEIAREQKVSQLAGQTEEAMRNDHTV